MTKLNQIIAIEKGIKSRTSSAISDNYKLIQKDELFNGFDKKYQAKEEGGDTLPNESKFVQHQGKNVLFDILKAYSDLYKVTSRKDWTNMTSKANVVVDGKILIEGAPVTFLLFLEKQLTDMRTFIGKLPVLDASEDWNEDANSGLFKTTVVSTSRTKKIQKPLVLFPATQEHPAQTQLVTEDVIAGTWQTVKLSGAMPKPLVLSYLEKIESLLKAVKEAREEANMTEEVKAPNVSDAVFNYIFS